mmetsp:Transcript_19005/g.52796  ORF Transcript_19005/g.52796 Transcript_19005/m.52796 type:complete len:277 (-) Transcript_19005:155-985(-)
MLPLARQCTIAILHSILNYHAKYASRYKYRLQTLSETVKAAESDDSIHGLVLHSAVPNIFSAGLDLKEFHKPDENRLPLYWHAFQQLYIDLYGSRLASVASIRGHTIAGGCILAMLCDYRMFASPPQATTTATNGSYNIGLNESRLGIVCAPWLAQLYIDTIGRRDAELALARGTLFNANDALQVGLVDQLVEMTHDDAILEAAQSYLRSWVAEIPSAARADSKLWFRKPRIDDLIRHRQSDADDFCAFMTQEHVQNNLQVYIDSLAKSRQKKGSS